MNLKHLFFLLVGLFFLIGPMSVVPVLAQAKVLTNAPYPSKFSENESEFISQLSDFMNRTQLNNVAITVNEFNALWSGKLDADQKKASILLFNTMLKKKLKSSPNF